jgi:hypothetical protein
MATDAQVIAVTQFGWAWLKAHEKLIMLALVLAVGTFGLSKYFDADAAKKDAKYVAAQQIAVNDQKNSAALALQTAQVTQQYQALVQALATQNAALNSSIAQRTALGNAQRTADATLPIPGLVARWTALIPTVTPTVTSNGVTVNEQGVRDTVSQLELVPILQGNLADMTKISGNYQREVEKSDVVANDLQSQVTGLQLQLADTLRADAAQLAAVKADARKGKIKWFKIGFLSGFLGGLYAGHSGL